MYSYSFKKRSIQLYNVLSIKLQKRNLLRLKLLTLSAMPYKAALDLHTINQMLTVAAMQVENPITKVFNASRGKQIEGHTDQ